MRIKFEEEEANNINEVSMLEQFGGNAGTDVWHFAGTEGPGRAQKATTEQQTTDGVSHFQKQRKGIYRWSPWKAVLQ